MPDKRVSSAKCHICGQKIPFTYGNPQELIQHMLGCHDQEPKHHLNSFNKSSEKLANSPNKTTKCNTCGGKRQSAGSTTLVNPPGKCTNHIAPLLGSMCDPGDLKKSPSTKRKSRKSLQKGDDFIDDSCLPNCPNESSSRINLGDFKSPLKLRIRCQSQENKSQGTCSCKVSDKRCPSRLANDRMEGKKADSVIKKCCACPENSKRNVSRERNSKKSVSMERNQKKSVSMAKNSKRSVSMERDPKGSFFMERNPKFSLTVPEDDNKPRKRNQMEKNKRSSSSSSPECHSGKSKRDSSVEKTRNSLMNRKLSTSPNDSQVEKRRKSSGTERINRLSNMPSPLDKNRNSMTEKRRSTLLDSNGKSLTEKIKNSISDRRRSSSVEKNRNSIADQKRNSIFGQKRKSSHSIDENKDKPRKCSMAGKNKRVSASLPPVDDQKCKFNVSIKKNESPTAAGKPVTCNKAVCFSNDSDGEKQSIIEYDKQDTCGKQTISPYSPCNLIKRKGTKEMYKTTLETWTAGCGHLSCPRCHRKVVPLIRKQKNKVAFSSVGASLLLTCWPFCFMLPMMHNCSVDLYCPCCKYKIGVYNSATGKTTSVCCKNPQKT